MTIIEKYMTWLVENNVVSIGPAIEKRNLNHEFDKAHKVFMDVNNPDDDKNRNAVKRLLDQHENASPAGKKHMEDRVRRAWENNEELAFQMGEHAPKGHPFEKIANQYSAP